jgi:hypothetical protein
MKERWCEWEFLLGFKDVLCTDVRLGFETTLSYTAHYFPFPCLVIPSAPMLLLQSPLGRPMLTRLPPVLLPMFLQELV